MLRARCGHELGQGGSGPRPSHLVPCPYPRGASICPLPGGMQAVFLRSDVATHETIPKTRREFLKEWGASFGGGPGWGRKSFRPGGSPRQLTGGVGPGRPQEGPGVPARRALNLAQNPLIINASGAEFSAQKQGQLIPASCTALCSGLWAPMLNHMRSKPPCRQH
eukprot:COSAG06_NODE_9788_length_1817_cov_2.051804_1_plen_165_part_00